MVFEGSFYSKVLDMETPVCIIAADDGPADEPRKVCYALHGLQGSCTNFIRYTMLPDLARSYHCLFVMPDVQRSFYADMVYGGKYFTYLTKELPVLVSDMFRVSEKPEDSYIFGISMGGYGALKAALTYPELYAACAAASPCCLDMHTYMTPEWRDGSKGDAFRTIFGDKLADDFNAAFGPIAEWQPENDLLYLAKKNTAAQKKPRLFTCWGSRDIFADSNRVFPEELGHTGWSLESEEMPGYMHNWTFFNDSLKKILPFLFRK